MTRLMSLGGPGVSLDSLDAARQLLQPSVQTHGHSPVLFADVGWAERSVGGRRCDGRLAAADQDVGLPPTQDVSDQRDEERDCLPHIVHWSEIYPVVD